MPRIHVLKPNVTGEEAMQQLTPSGLSGLMKTTLNGPLRSVAEFYIPFKLFRVNVANRGRNDSFIFGLDEVRGTLDLYRFENLPTDWEVAWIEIRNCLPAVLSDEASQRLIISKVQRLIFSSGFFRVRGLNISADPIPGDLHIPYWAGFYDRKKNVHFSVMDAVRRRMEGARVRQLLQNWLTSTQ